MADIKLNDASLPTITTLNNSDLLNPVVAADGEIQKITVADFRVGLGAPVMSFGVTLSQSGTSAPTQSAVFNNTPATFTYSYDGVGEYSLIADVPIFPSGGMIISALNGTAIVGGFYSIARADSSTLNILCSGDNVLLSASIKVEIYV